MKLNIDLENCWEFFTGDLSEAQKGAYEEKSEIVYFQKNQFIFRLGDLNDDVYFINKGAVQSEIYGQSGKLSYFRRRDIGAFFGEYAALTGKPRSADMIAVEDVELRRIKANDFISLVTHSPKAAEYMLSHVTSLLREETKRIAAFVTEDSKQRLINFLLSHEDSMIEVPSFGSMASFLNMTRETLSRHINDLVRADMVEKHKDGLVVKDRARLKQEKE